MALEQKQTPRSMEQNREPRTEPTHVQSINNTTMEAKYIVEKNTAYQQMVLEKLDSYMQKHQTGLLSHTIQKNIFKMD